MSKLVTMMRFLVFLMFVCFFFGVQAQQEYPLEIIPGKSKHVTAKSDTLWVIDNTQMKKGINDNLKLKNAEVMFVEFESEMKTLSNVIALKNGLIKKNKDGLDQYKKQWEESENQLIKEEEKVKKVKSKNKLWTGIGFVS